MTLVGLPAYSGQGYDYHQDHLREKGFLVMHLHISLDDSLDSYLSLKAYASEEILNRHSLSLSLNADFCIHFF